MARVRVLPTDARAPGRRETDAALSLANRMPRLVLEARRVAASMAYASDLAGAPKIERALVLGLALADGFVEAGERVGLLGLAPPRATRHIAERMAEAIVADRAGLESDLPPATPLAVLDEAVIVGDFLAPL